jgi:hypothetical protein
MGFVKRGGKQGKFLFTSFQMPGYTALKIFKESKNQ